jgi:EpsI family protein
MHKTTGWLRSASLGWLVPAGLILAAQGAALHVLSIPERDVHVPQLNGLPLQVGEWKTTDEHALDPGVQEYLKPDSYVLRDYANQARGNSINLFVAYFKSLQSGYGPHSPKVCLPGNGWLTRAESVQLLPVPGHSEGIPVNQFIMEKANSHILVLYWYQNDRNVWAEEFQGKLRLLPDLIRYRRSDVSLVRLVEPLRGDIADQELMDCREFTRLMFPALVENFGKRD